MMSKMRYAFCEGWDRPPHEIPEIELWPAVERDTDEVAVTGHPLMHLCSDCRRAKEQGKKRWLWMSPQEHDEYSDRIGERLGI